MAEAGGGAKAGEVAEFNKFRDTFFKYHERHFELQRRMKSDRKPLSTVEELKARDRAADFLCDLARAARNEYADSCSRFILDCFSDKDIMQRILDLFSYHNVKALLEGRRRDLKLDPLTNANKGAPGLYVLWDLFIGDTPCEYIGKAVQVGRRVLRQHLDPSYREEAQASFQLYDPEVDWTRVKHGVLLNLSSPINVVFSDDTVKKILMLAEAVAIQLGGFYRHGRRAIINIYTLHMLTAQAAEFEKQSHGGSRGINSRLRMFFKINNTPITVGKATWYPAFEALERDDPERLDKLATQHLQLYIQTEKRIAEEKKLTPAERTKREKERKGDRKELVASLKEEGKTPRVANKFMLVASLTDAQREKLSGLDVSEAPDREKKLSRLRAFLEITGMSVILSNIPEEEDGQEGPAPKPFLSKASETWAKTLVQNDLKNLSFDEQVKMMLEYEKDDKNLTLKKIERATKLHVLLFWNDAAGRRKTCDVVGMDKSVSVIAHQARAIARVVDGELVPTMEDMVETGLKLYVGVGEAPRELTEEDKEAIKNGTLLLTASKKSTASKTAKLPEAENKSNTSNGTASPAPDGGSPLLNGALGTPASTATPAPAASVAKTYTPPLGSLSKPPPKFSLLPSSSSSITFPAPLGPTSGFPPQIPFATSTPCTANPSSVLPPPRSVKRGSSSSEDAVEPKKRKTEQS